MPPTPVPPPVLKTTPYESVSSFLIAVTTGLIVIVGLLAFAVQVTRVPAPQNAIPVEIMDVPGGGSPEGELGAEGNDLEVDVPDPAADSSVAEGQVDETDVREALDTVVQTSDALVGQAQQQFQLELPRAGKPGGGKGTGKRPLGEGPGSGGGVRRELRWYIRYADSGSIEEYAKQLDYFGVELGAVLNGELVYLSNLSGARPTVRRVKSGSAEKRLYFTWRGGQRRQADIQLFQKAGIEVADAIMMQFVPPDREQELARLELSASKRNILEVRRTYFGVRPQERGRGYEFHITRQIFFDAK